MTHAIDIMLGQRIRAGRSLRGMTLEQLASHIGCVFQQVQRYETAQSRVSASRLHQIARALDLPPNYFLDDTAEMDPAVLETAKVMVGLTGAQRAAVLNIARTMKEAV